MTGSPRCVAYTDGACAGNPGPGGWAWIRTDGPYASGAAAHTTNQRMELQAVLEAVRHVDGPLHVISDSTYVVNCFRDRWWEGWIRRGWTNSQRKPVANRDLWEPLVDAVREGDVTFEWVKGHAGDEWNDLADRLAVEAAATQSARSGAERPAEVGAPDRAWAPFGITGAAGVEAPRRDPTGREAPAGHLLAVLGSRSLPDGEEGRRLGLQLEEIVGAKSAMHDDLVVVSGLRLGAEQLGAEAAIRADVPLVVVLPFPDPAAMWPPAQRATFDHLVECAAQVIVLQQKAPADRKAIIGALARRDSWLARNSREAVIVRSAHDTDLDRTIRAFVDAMGELDVWVIDVEGQELRG